MTGTRPAPEGGSAAALQDGHIGGDANAWLTVGLMCLLIGASFLDRNIIALLVDPIHRDLGASDKQIGLLFGLGFAAFYVVAGIPLAHFADRGSRKRLLLFGVLAWSLTTFVAAFATNFAVLVVARAGVAIGEAVLTPVAVSLIADLYPLGRRALPTSLFLTAGAMMGAGSPILGGAAYALAGHLAAETGIAAWRLTFAIVAVPGLILALVYFILISEPARRFDPADQGIDASMASAFRYFFRNFMVFGPVFVGVGIMLINAIAISAWGPTLLIREHGLSPASAGLAIGAASLVGAVAGSLSVPIAIRFMPGGSEVSRIVLAVMICPLATVPFMTFGIANASLVVTLGAVAIGVAGVITGPVFAPLLVQAAAPARLRARMTAFYLTANIMISLGLGPVLVPLLARYDPGRPIGGALSLISAITLGVAVVGYLLGNRAVRAQARRGGVATA